MSFLLSLKFCQKAFTPVKISSFYFSNTLPNKTFKMANQTPLVWIDCEMTGLDSSVDHLLEIAVIITDSELNLLHEGIELVINHPRSVLDGMNEWCQVHHKQSGLIDRVLESEIQLSKAEDIVFEYITRFVEKAGVAPLAGNSVHADKQFLVKYMPKVTNYLHYRIVGKLTFLLDKLLLFNSLKI